MILGLNDTPLPNIHPRLVFCLLSSCILCLSLMTCVPEETYLTSPTSCACFLESWDFVFGTFFLLAKQLFLKIWTRLYLIYSTPRLLFYFTCIYVYLLFCQPESDLEVGSLD